MRKLSGHTTAYAVFGHPIGHTLSPIMHNRSFEALGLDAIYLAFDVAPEKLMDVLPRMADLGFGGINLTVPLKEVAFRGLEQLDLSARRLGAVNTVQFTENGLVGHNTDGVGFVRALREAFGASVEGASVFVLGSGGAGRAVAITCAVEGASRIGLTDLDEPRARKVVDEIRAMETSTQIGAVPPVPPTWERTARDADLVIQCTPVGMKAGDPPLLSADAFREGQFVLDLIYMYPETPLMTVAREAGARVSNGLGMLLHQGAQSFTIWTGQTADVDAMRAALEEAVYGQD